MGDALVFLRGFGRHIQAEAEDLTARIVDETYRSVPGYSVVPREDFVPATRSTVAAIAEAFAAGRLVEDDGWDFDAETVRRRLRQGVRAKDWIAHTRVFLSVMRDAAAGFGRDAAIADADVMAGLLAIEEVAQSGVAFAGEEFDKAADELLHQDEAERREFVSALLRGALVPTAMRAGVAALGLDPDALYRAVRIRALEPLDQQQLLRRVLRSEPTVAPRGVWAAIADDVCGITQDGAPPDLDGAAAGVGPVVPLEAVGSSYAAATAALETVCRFGLAGAHTVEDLGALPLVLGGGRAGDTLVERFVGRVERSGTGGTVLVQTVAAYLAHGMQAGVTAEALHLHPNSLRKRLRRYEELAGADLSSIADLVAVWCALKRREADERSQPALTPADTG